VSPVHCFLQFALRTDFFIRIISENTISKRGVYDTIGSGQGISDAEGDISEINTEY
jgi:hypothetical protein